MPKRKQSRKTKHLLTQSINPHAAGIDIGAEELMAAIPADLDVQPVSSPFRKLRELSLTLRGLRRSLDKMQRRRAEFFLDT